MGKFQVEGPKILTELFWEASETTKSVNEVGRTAVPGKLLLLIVKLRSCTLPPVIWIREALVEEVEAEEVEDAASVDADGGSEWVLPLWEWISKATSVTPVVDNSGV